MVESSGLLGALLFVGSIARSALLGSLQGRLGENMVLYVGRVVRRVGGVVCVEAGAEWEETHDSAISSVNVENRVITLGVNSDTETLLDLIEREDVGDRVWAIPYFAKVLNVPHLCGRVRAAIRLNGVGVSTGPNIGKERSVGENVRRGTSVEDDPSLGKSGRGEDGELHVGGDGDLGKREMPTKVVGRELHEFVRRRGCAIGRGRRRPTCRRCRRGFGVVARGRIAVLGIFVGFQRARRLVVDEHLVGMGDRGGILVSAAAELVTEIRAESIVTIAGVFDEKGSKCTLLGLDLGRVESRRGKLLLGRSGGGARGDGIGVW